MSDELIVLGVVGLFVLGFAALIAYALALEKKRKKQWSDFAELHRLRSDAAEGQPWTGHFAFRLGRESRFSDLYTGEIRGVPVALFNTSTGGSGKDTSHGTFLALALDRTDLPECMLLPGALGATFKRLLNMVGGMMGARAHDLPGQPELERTYTVLGPAEADLDATLGAIDFTDFVSRPARAIMIGRGWLFVGPIPGRTHTLHVLQTLDELQELVDQALELREIVAAW